MLCALPLLLAAGCRVQAEPPLAADPEPQPPEIAEPAPPPLVFEWEDYFDAKTRQEDLDKDGQPETIEEGRAIGSGGGLIRECVRRGFDGQRACLEWDYTVYTRFARFRTFGVGAPPSDGAIALLQLPACAQADRGSPAQGSFWLLAEPEGVAREPRWFPGPPAAQEAVCVSAEAARAMGGLGWWGEETDAEGWKTIWRPSWVDHDPPAIVNQPDQPPLKRAIQADAVEIWYQGHAVALYDQRQDRHAWLANVERQGGSTWRVDRHPIIESLRLSEGALVIEVNGEPEMYGEEVPREERRKLEIPLPR